MEPPSLCKKKVEVNCKVVLMLFVRDETDNWISKDFHNNINIYSNKMFKEKKCICFNCRFIQFFVHVYLIQSISSVFIHTNIQLCIFVWSPWFLYRMTGAMEINCVKSSHK